ncbi:NAD(P)-binding protein [Annulohypoxylon maeteangense]|uniref:NAD(P)-binding protein n=1 Tax=Annulohypoxylon maeteangense TaxID=1927788 RepID=UPI0020082D86|nr:NAD(P)-binding protein [Annulohypoxylon maeteangense]KAI0880237.1 NAD(P)-binding protein [Annulohypoxylon maeteangense]
MFGDDGPADILKSSYQYGTSALNQSSRSQPLRTFLFGYPLHNSLAPLLHAKIFEGLSIPWTYSPMETQDASRFIPALKAPDVIGCAVTMPYKVSMMSVVDEVTAEGKIIGAINTVFIRKAHDGSPRYIGTNTDCIGVRESFLQNFPDVLEHSTGKPGLVIGGGGACRSAIYALWKWLGASKIYLVNRIESEVTDMIQSLKTAGFDGELIYVSSVEMAEGLEAPVLVVGTVPDFAPREEGEITARNIITTFLSKERKGYVLEMCYHPKPRTEFFEMAVAAGWKVLYGTEPMIYQGVAQQVLWTELSQENFSLDEVKKVISEKLEKI